MSLSSLEISTIDTSFKPVMGVCGIEWGYHKYLEHQLPKLWYLSGLKSYWIYFKQFCHIYFSGIKVTEELNLQYILPCSGCKKCKTNDLPNEKMTSSAKIAKYFQFYNTKNVVETKSYDNINEYCGNINTLNINVSDIMILSFKW